MERRSARLLVLAAVFFLSGLVFFFARMDDTRAPVAASRIETKTTGAAPVPHLANLPRPEAYEHFTYAGEVTRTVSATCSDSYATLMLYAASVDYRVSPADAKYNRAVECTGSGITHDIPLTTLALTPGTEYYVIRAHQGSVGGWYDPY